MPNRSRKNISLWIILILLFSPGCATVYNPATGRSEMIMIDTAREVSLGREMDAKIRKDMKLADDQGMQRRLETVGNRIARYSDRQDLQYHFTVVENKELNAFAVPGGYVYAHSGLMKAATDDELAGVVAHEIGHIEARHSVKQLQTTMGYQMVMSIAMGLTGQSNLNQATDIVYNLVNLGYSRKDEFQADKLAVRYTRRANYKPYGIVTFFEKLDKEAKQRGGGSSLPFFSSHPPTQERIRKVLDEISINPY